MSEQQHPGTALITGASSGIGASYARRLAEAGYHLVLVARRGDRLQALAEALSKQPVKVEILMADLAQDADVARVEQHIRARTDLTLLINNAGFGSGGLFYQVDPAKQFNMIHVHVVATARLTRAVLPQMVERGRGAVINVASIAAFAVAPTSAMYGSTKAWMVAFSQAIAEELRETGVRVQALCPGFTYTEFHDTPEYKDFDRAVVPRFLWMTADAVVTDSLQALARNRIVCIPGLANKLIVALLRLPLVPALARYYGRRRWRRKP
jgi:short-subunit dehydrogenase